MLTLALASAIAQVVVLIPLVIRIMPQISTLVLARVLGVISIAPPNMIPRREVMLMLMLMLVVMLVLLLLLIPMILLMRPETLTLTLK